MGDWETVDVGEIPLPKDVYCWRPVTFEQWEFEKHSPESDVPHTGPSSWYCGIYPQTLEEHERSVRRSERSRALGKFKWYEDLSKVERVELWISERNMTMDQKLTTRHIWRAVKEGRVPEYLPTGKERMKAFIDLISKFRVESGLTPLDIRTPERRALDEARAARRAAAPPAPVRGPSFWTGKTMKLCDDALCKVESHYRSGAFPVRLVRNRVGNWCMWVPEEVLPSVCTRMCVKYKMPVLRGSKRRYRARSQSSRTGSEGSAKWDWSVVRDGA